MIPKRIACGKITSLSCTENKTLIEADSFVPEQEQSKAKWQTELQGAFASYSNHGYVPSSKRASGKNRQRQLDKIIDKMGNYGCRGALTLAQQSQSKPNDKNDKCCWCQRILDVQSNKKDAGRYQSKDRLQSTSEENFLAHRGRE